MEITFLCLPVGLFYRADVVWIPSSRGTSGSGGPSLRAGQQQRRLLAVVEAAGPQTLSRLPLQT